MNWWCANCGHLISSHIRDGKCSAVTGKTYPNSCDCARWQDSWQAEPPNDANQ